MKRIILFFKVFFVCLCFHSTAKAESYDSLQVYLLTCEPHDEIYSLYGHTAIRVVNPRNNMDIAINYGAFDSSSRNFVLRFVFGLTDYMMMVYSYSDFLAEYRYFGSAVRQQHVNMSPEEKRVFMAALAESAKPENITYRYNYFYNNCTTKARDIILGAISGEKVVERPATDEHPTYRDLIHIKTADSPWAAWGNDFLLGVLADVKTTDYEAEFIPDRLMDDFNHTVVVDFDGNKRQLVDEDIVVLQSGTPHFKPMEGFPLRPLTVFCILAAIIVIWSIVKKIVTCHHPSSFIHHPSSIIDYVVCCLYAIPGILLFCMLFSQHPTVSLNFQILIFNPLLFWLANPKCQVQRRWEIILGCVVLFLVLGLVQSYAEGVIMLACALGCLALSNIKLQKKSSHSSLTSHLLLLTSSIILLSSCHSSSKVAKDDVYGVGSEQKYRKIDSQPVRSGKVKSDVILSQAMSLLGTKYRVGGADPRGFDCSGFTSYVYGQNGISIGRSSRDQYAQNTPINRNQIRPGDLVFFSGTRIGSGVGHVGIVTEVDKSADTFFFIHSSTNGGVVVTSSANAYYAQRYLGARRVE